MKRNRLLFTLFRFALFVFALFSARVLSLSAQSGTASGVVYQQTGGGLIRTVPFAPIVLCNYPPTGGTPCTNLATTFNAFAGTACSPGQGVIPTTATCSSTSDANGNFTFYAAAANYVYYIQVANVWSGPYPMSVNGVPANIPGISGTPSPDQIAIWATGAAIKGVAMSGDATMTGGGVVTNTGLKGSAVPALAAGFLNWNGSAFSWTTPSGTVANQVKCQPTTGLSSTTLSTTTATVYTACQTGATEDLRIIAAFNALSGNVSHVVDDDCGTGSFNIQTWASQPFTNRHGIFEIRNNCTHIINLDGVSTITTQSDLKLRGMGETGSITSSAALGTMFRACNTLLDDCINGGFTVQNSNNFTTTVSGNVMTILLGAGAPFSTTVTAVNHANDQGRLLCIVGSAKVDNDGCWPWASTLQATAPQQFTVNVPSGLTPCGSSCGTVYLDTPMFSIGNGGGSATTYHVEISDISIDCNYVPGCGGFVNAQGQENTSLGHIQVWNSAAYYGRLDQSTSYGGPSTGMTNSGEYGPWAGNIANTDCRKTGGCPCMLPLASTVSTSGSTETWISGAQFPPNLTTTKIGSTTYTISQVNSATTITTTTPIGTNASIAATQSNPGMDACNILGVPGTAPQGSIMGCGRGGQSSPQVYLINPDPCINPNYSGWLFTGVVANQGFGRVSRMTASISDKSDGGGHGIDGLQGNNTLGKSAAFRVIGVHGSFGGSHPEYFPTGLEIGGDATNNFSWEKTYDGIVTGGFQAQTGFWNFGCARQPCSAARGIIIGANNGLQDVVVDIDIRAMDLGVGSLPSLEDRAFGGHGNTCTSDTLVTYFHGHGANPKIDSSCTEFPNINAAGVVAGTEAMSGASPAPSCSVGNLHRETLAATTTVGTPTGCFDGQDVNFEVTQAGFALNFNATYVGFPNQVAQSKVCGVKGHWNTANSKVYADSAIQCN